MLELLRASEVIGEFVLGLSDVTNPFGPEPLYPPGWAGELGAAAGAEAPAAACLGEPAPP